MIVVDTQIHGYLRGHQLLSSSVDLPKSDQSVIDMLSDVAGPLRPNERFEPYLSGYPLPSGDRYVLARTWQDLTVARAGCVRTLSLVIPALEWATAKSLSPFLDLLDPFAFPQTREAASRMASFSPEVRPIAPVRDFRGGELLEALFLEETKARRSIWHARTRTDRDEADYGDVGRFPAGVRFLDIRSLSASDRRTTV